jgi:acetoin utilization protein AcuB
LEDRPGSIKEVADVIRSHGGRIVSILSTKEFAAEGRRDVFIRATALKDVQVRSLISELENKYVVLYTVRDLLEEVEKRRVRIPY